MNINLNIVIMIALIIAALWTVMSRSLIRSAIGLALTSAILTVLMFNFNSPLAAVFELSVCSGLISVLFISTISLTEPLNREEIMRHMKARLSRFWYLPVIVVIAGILFGLFKIKLNLKPFFRGGIENTNFILWNLRQLDLVGQIIILLAGVFGVIILLKEMHKNE